MVTKIEKKILFALVTYKEVYYETNSFKSLLSSFFNEDSNRPLFVYIYDNTPIEKWKIEEVRFSSDIKISYHHDFSNPGISKAYNKIGSFAKENGFDAVVFLDQDTHLPCELYSVYIQFCKKNTAFNVAIPKISVHDTIVSPARYHKYKSYLLTDFKKGWITINQLSWINSGMMIETDFFISSGGYNEEIQLDFSDHSYIEKIKQQGLTKVYLLPIILHQEFSAYTNSLAQDINRYKLFLRDFRSYRKDKNWGLLFINVDLPRLLRLTLKHKTFQFLNMRFKM